MNRRHFAVLGLGAALSPGAVLANYAPDPFVMDTWRAQRRSEELAIYNFRASWSITCDLKAELLDEIMCKDARFTNLPVVEVDWDIFGPSEMAQRLKVKRQSTLVLLRGRTEIARLENEPFERPIRQFLEQAAAAAG